MGGSQAGISLRGDELGRIWVSLPPSGMELCLGKDPSVEKVGTGWEGLPLAARGSAGICPPVPQEGPGLQPGSPAVPAAQG